MKLTDQQYFEAERELKRNYAGLSSETIRIDELARILQCNNNEQALGIAMKALNELSCLGNGNMRGNSQGNEIAYRALGDIQTALSQKELLHCGQFFGDEPCIALGLHFMHQTARGMQWRAFADNDAQDDEALVAYKMVQAYQTGGMIAALAVSRQHPPHSDMSREIIKRLEGAYIVAGLPLPIPTDWQVAIDRFVAATQAQGHLAKLASERYDKILELERNIADQHPPQGWHTTEQVQEAIVTCFKQCFGHIDTGLFGMVLARLNQPKPTPEERIAKVMQESFGTLDSLSYYLPHAAKIIAELAKEESK